MSTEPTEPAGAYDLKALARILDPVAVQRELRRRRWARDPLLFVEESYAADPEGRPARLDPPQQEVLQALAEHDRVVVRACHGVGKTALAALAAMWWVATRSPALVVTMAGTWGHLEDKLWPELHAWSRCWTLREEYEWQVLGAYRRGLDGRGEARIKASASDKAINVEGWHNPNLLVIIDEAKGVPDEVNAAIRGALTQMSARGEKAKVLALSTPPLSPAGWYVQTASGKVPGWRVIHVAAKDSPRVSREWVEEMARDYGEGSAVYVSKVLGDIPADSADVVLPAGWIEAAQERPRRPDRRGCVLSLDVARQGEDLAVMGKIEASRFDLVRWSPTTSLTELVGWVVGAVAERERLIAETGERHHQVRAVVVDDTGVGGGVVDGLVEKQREGKLPRACIIIPVQFGASAIMPDRFHSAKDEMWWRTRDALRMPLRREVEEAEALGRPVPVAGRLALPSPRELAALQLPRASDLVAQLAAPIYEEDSQSRIRVLDKRLGNVEKARALPTKSPDLAHALILAVRGWLALRDEIEPDPARTVSEIQRRERVEVLKRERNPPRRSLYRRR